MRADGMSIGSARGDDHGVGLQLPVREGVVVPVLELDERGRDRGRSCRADERRWARDRGYGVRAKRVARGLQGTASTMGTSSGTVSPTQQERPMHIDQERDPGQDRRARARWPARLDGFGDPSRLRHARRRVLLARGRHRHRAAAAGARGRCLPGAPLGLHARRARWSSPTPTAPRRPCSAERPLLLAARAQRARGRRRRGHPLQPAGRARRT